MLDEGDLRTRILNAPDTILDDGEVMEALMSAGEAMRGGNVVDLRGALVARLETRLDRLTDMHRTVVAAAYDTIAGMRQVHRAALAMLAYPSGAALARGLQAEIAPILRIDRLRLLVEDGAAPALLGHDDAIAPVPWGFVAGYVGQDGDGGRRVALRPTNSVSADIYAPDAIGSEACLRLDLGTGPALALLGAVDPARFAPQQGTDLLEFLAGVLERVATRHL